MSTSTSIKTALHDTHVAQGGKMVDFGGYRLPVWYKSLKEEHLAVRQNAGVFDISHMCFLEVTGSDAFDFLQKLSCNDANKTLNNIMVYSMILNENGGIMDDVMFGKIDDASYALIANAGNRQKIKAWVEAQKSGDVTVTDRSETHAFLAVQGPNAVSILSDYTGQPLADAKRFSVFRGQINGNDVVFLRTGYTGEDGYEILVPNQAVETVWNDLQAKGCTPCGLGARDSLRLEFGLPLYGNDLNEDINPYMTRYKWVVKLDTDFIGKEALLAEKEKEQPLVAVGLEMTERQIARSQYKIQEGGYVSSGTLSPSLDKPIALAFVPPAYKALGSQVHVEIRGKAFEATVVEVPFK